MARMTVVLGVVLFGILGVLLTQGGEAGASIINADVNITVGGAPTTPTTTTSTTEEPQCLPDLAPCKFRPPCCVGVCQGRRGARTCRTGTTTTTPRTYFTRPPCNGQSCTASEQCCSGYICIGIAAFGNQRCAETPTEDPTPLPIIPGPCRPEESDCYSTSQCCHGDCVEVYYGNGFYRHKCIRL